MLNDVKLCGRLTADPELKTTTGGHSVCSFSLAVERDYAKDGNRETDFIDIVAWRGTAEFISKFFAKGKMVIVSGSLQKEKYTANDGTNRYATKVVADKVWFAGDKSANNTAQNTPDLSIMPPAAAPAPSFNNDYTQTVFRAPTTDYEEILGDEDLPF